MLNALLTSALVFQWTHRLYNATVAVNPEKAVNDFASNFVQLVSSAWLQREELPAQTG